MKITLDERVIDVKCKVRVVRYSTRGILVNCYKK